MPKQIYTSWFRKIEWEMVKWGKIRWRVERAVPLTSRNLSPSLSLPQPFSPFISVCLSLLRISPNPPITVMSGWEQGRRRRQREAVRDWEGRYGVRKEEIHHYFFICYKCHSSPDPALIGWWRLTAGSRCQDLECSLLSFWLCGSWCVSNVGMWTKMKMPGWSHSQHIFVAMVSWLNWWTGWPPLTLH